MSKALGAQSEAERFRALRLSEEQIIKILDELDHANDPTEGGSAASPSTKTYRYRVAQLRVHLHGAHAVLHYAPTRWIGATGIAFLHGCYLYEGTPCVCQLITLHGMWNDVSGVVRSCRYVDAHIYEVEVRFAQRVDPALYCAEAATSRVLIVDDDPLTLRIVTAHLNKLNATVDQAENGEVAVGKALKKPYDLILMDIDMPVKTGVEALAELRDQGYAGSIVAMSSLSQPAERERCLTAGFDQFLEKPFGRDELEKLLKAIRQEPIFSSLADDASMRDLIREFVEHLPKEIRALQDAITKEDLQRVETVLRNMKAHGSSYGFEIITKQAAETEAALRECGSLKGVRDRMHRLLELCSLVRAPRATSGS